MRNRIFQTVIWLLLLVFLSAVSWAQEPIIYPGKGQSPEQMEKDKFACYEWAKQQSGFDPANTADAPNTAPTQSSGAGGERVKGAARGAAVGAVAGAIAGDAGTGAAAGAAGGAMIGGMRKRRAKREEAKAQEQTQQAEASAYEKKRSAYDRAYSACLEGKGYTVK